MDLKEFDVYSEERQLNELHNQNFPKWFERKKQLSLQTKFSLNDIIEYLEYGISSYFQDNWIIRKIAFYDEITKKIDLCYYAILDDFDSVIRSLVKKGSKNEEEINQNIEFLQKNDMMFLIGSKELKIESRDQLFDAIENSDNEKRNYLEEHFFNFPKDLDGLYNIIVDHINRKNNQGYSYTKKS